MDLNNWTYLWEAREEEENKRNIPSNIKDDKSFPRNKWKRLTIPPLTRAGDICNGKNVAQ